MHEVRWCTVRAAGRRATVLPSAIPAGGARAARAVAGAVVASAAWWWLLSGVASAHTPSADADPPPPPAPPVTVPLDPDDAVDPEVRAAALGLAAVVLDELAGPWLGLAEQVVLPGAGAAAVDTGGVAGGGGSEGGRDGRGNQGGAGEQITADRVGRPSERAADARRAPRRPPVVQAAGPWRHDQRAWAPAPVDVAPVVAPTPAAGVAPLAPGPPAAVTATPPPVTPD